MLTGMRLRPWTTALIPPLIIWEEFLQVLILPDDGEHPHAKYPRSFQGGGLFPAISLGEDREEGISSVFYERGEHWHTQPYDPSILLGNGDGTRICGFFQSERYLWDIGEEKVKEWFSLKDLPPSNTFELA